MDSSTTFLYEVRPTKTIFVKSLNKNIKSAKSYMLTKEDVYECLPKARLYRRFPEVTERVNTGNVERLHNEVYYTEEEWEKEKIKENATGSQQVKEMTVEEFDNHVDEAFNMVKDEVEEFTDLVKNISDNKLNNNESVEDKNEVVEESTKEEIEEVNTDETKETPAVEQQNDTGIGDQDKSEEESVEAAMIQDETVEEGTESKEGNDQVEQPKRDQNNTNRQKNHHGKKHNNR